MSNDLFHSKRSQEMEAEFLKLRESRIEEYEATSKRMKETWEIEAENANTEMENMRSILKESGIDLKKLEEMEAQEKRKLDEQLKKSSKRKKEKPDLKSRHRERIARSLRYGRLGGSNPVCIGADVISSNTDFLKEMSGASGKGNPYVWFYDPSEIKHINPYVWGSGWGCLRGRPLPWALWVKWWYAWVPPEDLDYWILAEFPYLGFFRMRANDKWHNCKKAGVSGLVQLRVNQDGSELRCEERDLVKKEAWHINTIDNPEPIPGSSKLWDFHQYLEGRDLVIFEIGVCLICQAQGDGSYANINFAEADGNYVGPPEVWIFWS